MNSSFLDARLPSGALQIRVGLQLRALSRLSILLVHYHFFDHVVLTDEFAQDSDALVCMSLKVEAETLRSTNLQ